MYSNESNLVIMGDFNSKFVAINNESKGMRTRDVYVSSFANNMNYTVVTETDLCCGSNVSFIPYGDGLPSLIDHIIVDETLLPAITSCIIKPDSPLNVSRHLSTYITIVINPINDMHKTLSQFR